MQQNTKIEDPLPDFFTTLCTPSKEFENNCASMHWNLVKVITDLYNKRACSQTMFKILRLRRQCCQIKRKTGLPKTWGQERAENKNLGGGGTLAKHG
jgi:hypothetical protein